MQNKSVCDRINCIIGERNAKIQTLIEIFSQRRCTRLKNRKLLLIMQASLLAALVAVATMIIKIPTPTGGYVNIGDGVVLLCGWLLGPVWGTLAAGIGSMLADLIGYPIYAPGTFVIKALMALAAFGIARLCKTVFKRHAWPAYLLSGIAAEAVMIIGYFIFEAVFLSYGTGALVGILPNAVQAVAGVAVGTALMCLIDRAHFMQKINRK